MLISLKKLLGYDIKARDGNIGSVEDFLFDDHMWTLRYLVANTGNWLVDRLVLISPVAVGESQWTTEELEVALTKDRIENSPPLSNDRPVSKQLEGELSEYYGWPLYWYGLANGAAPMQAPMIPLKRIKKKEGDPDDDNPNLRSLNEIINYNIKAKDDNIGRVDDIIADDEDWSLKYLVVDTNKFLPGSKKVIFAINWISSIDFYDASVSVDLMKETIEKAPEFDPSEPINRVYEEQVYDFYGRPKYWK